MREPLQPSHPRSYPRLHEAYATVREAAAMARGGSVVLLIVASTDDMPVVEGWVRDARGTPPSLCQGAPNSRRYEWPSRGQLVVLPLTRHWLQRVSSIEIAHYFTLVCLEPVERNVLLSRCRLPVH